MFNSLIITHINDLLCIVLVSSPQKFVLLNTLTITEILIKDLGFRKLVSLTQIKAMDYMVMFCCVHT